MRLWTLALLLGLACAADVRAQADGWRFRWQAGQVLTYRVEHNTTAAHQVKDSRVQTASKLTLVKRWQVLAVDGNGVATLQFSLAAMRNEQTQFNGEVLLFDSQDPDKSHPALREHLAKFIGKPLAVIRVDPAGKVVEVKQGSAEQYEAEPPFVLTLPAVAPQAGQRWTRAYNVTLAPPQGTGEKYQATQTYTCKAVDGPLVTVALKTDFQTAPDSPQDRIPLFQKQPTGEVVFDTQGGRLQRARLHIRHELNDIQGAGSTYRFESTYTEEFVPQGDR